MGFPQQARDLLDDMGIPNAQAFTNSDVAEVADLIANTPTRFPREIDLSAGAKTARAILRRMGVAGVKQYSDWDLATLALLAGASPIAVADTDRELLFDLFDSFNVGFTRDKVANTVTCTSGDNKVVGAAGKYTVFQFGNGGKFVSIGSF